MLAKDQLKLIAQEIDRTADHRMHDCQDAYDRQQLWEVVRRASRVIEAVAGMERDGVTQTERSRRVRYVVSELEVALDAARRARVVIDWTEQHPA
jgi:predicted oxidoreductase